VRSDLILKGILPANQSFQGGEGLIFFQIGLYMSAEETPLSLEREQSV
jgi:hypothetical protein